jgi:hypothetical protein
MSTVSRSTTTGLAATLRAGAVYDWILALTIIASPAPLFELLRVPAPADPFLFRLSALPLIFFGALYWQVSADPPGRRWAVRLSIAIRFLGGAYVGILALIHHPHGYPLFMAIMLIDWAWALVWLALDRGSSVPGRGGK